MNFLQRNPNDPQYEEFHHGEYEYWPVDGGLKSKSISFPAALVSGLELLAAVAGAGLLAAALTVMYVLSAPLSIHEHTATINANVYNNLDDLSISYVLTSGPSIVQEGTLDGDEDTLNLQGLNSGTTYLLKYYDADQKEIGKFQFTTPGEQEIPEDPNPDNDLQQPVDPKPDDNRDPVVNPETDKEPEAGTEATESTEATTVPTEVPIRPGYRPLLRSLPNRNRLRNLSPILNRNRNRNRNRKYLRFRHLLPVHPRFPDSRMNSLSAAYWSMEIWPIQSISCS